MNPDLGVYVHWPYCARICPYCDFNVRRDRGRTEEQAALVDAIVRDLEGHAAMLGPRGLASVFLGGGTPSLMTSQAVGRIVDTATRLWPPVCDLEITLEANPTDAETVRFTELARAGVNRLSLGLQSLDDRQLRFLGRNHDAITGRRAAERAMASFPRVSLDLIYATPGQTVAEWTTALREAASLGSEHISAYQLTIEPDTAFARAARRGDLQTPAEPLAADLFETTQAVLSELGFEAYEISNHARGEAARSRHNLIYWRGGDYIGVGPGAHGRLTQGGLRVATFAPRTVGGYLANVARQGRGAVAEKLAAREVALERLLMGLRTIEGVETAELAPLNIPDHRWSEFEGLAEVRGGRVIATARGRPVLDRIVAELAHVG